MIHCCIVETNTMFYSNYVLIFKKVDVCVQNYSIIELYLSKHKKKIDFAMDPQCERVYLSLIGESKFPHEIHGSFFSLSLLFIAIGLEITKDSTNHGPCRTVVHY